MKESFLSKAKADGEVLLRTVNLVTRISKLKLNVRSKKQEREKLLKTIGVAIFDIYREARRLDSEAITNAVGSDLRTVTDVDAEIIDLQAEVERLRSDFKASTGKPAPEPDTTK